MDWILYALTVSSGIAFNRWMYFMNDSGVSKFDIPFIMNFSVMMAFAPWFFTNSATSWKSVVWMAVAFGVACCVAGNLLNSFILQRSTDADLPTMLNIAVVTQVVMNAMQDIRVNGFNKNKLLGFLALMVGSYLLIKAKASVHP